MLFIVIVIGILTLHYNNFTPKKVMDYITIKDDTDIMLNISGGILTLIGLSAIFVSLNVQHKIEKARELYWSMFNVRNEDIEPFEMKEKLESKLSKYGNVFNSDNYIQKIIVVTRFAVLVVSIIWSMFVAMYAYEFSKHSLAWISLCLGLSVLFFFYHFLGLLRNLSLISGLPSLENILDVGCEGESKSKINKVLLTASSIEIVRPLNLSKITPPPPPILRIALNIPLNNLRVDVKSISGISVNKENNSYHYFGYSREYKGSIKYSLTPKEHIGLVEDWNNPLSTKYKSVFEIHEFTMYFKDIDVCVIKEKELYLPKGTKMLEIGLTIATLSNEDSYEVEVVCKHFLESIRSKPIELKFKNYGNFINYKRQLTEIENIKMQKLNELM